MRKINFCDIEYLLCLQLLNQFMLTHVIQTHVDQTATHQESSVTVVNAPAFQKWLARRPTAVQSVQSTRIVRRTRLVSTASARILVLACVEWMLCATLGTMCHCVSVSKAILGTHSHNAIDQQVSKFYRNIERGIYLPPSITIFFFFFFGGGGGVTNGLILVAICQKFTWFIKTYGFSMDFYRV